MRWPRRRSRYLHDHAEELHIDPDKIAVLGFSAGAHLTGALGTMGRIRPAALLLGYGVYAADGVAMGVQMPNVLNHIDAQTPPSFLFATQGDRLAGLCLPPGGAAHPL